MAEKKVVKKNLGGRPSKLPLINKEHFEGMCKIQFSIVYICGIFNVNEQTLTKWCEHEYSMGFCDIYKKLSSTGKMSLRRQQFKSAENGNVTMQIWLGKQWLGQTDKVESSNINIGTETALERIENIVKNRFGK